VSLDANDVIELLNDGSIVIQKMKTIDFDDPMSLDGNAYLNILHLMNGKTCAYCT
jgi:uncharacterized protein YqkB